jgi:ChrR Cupin-like domain
MTDKINQFVLGTMTPEERAAMAEARRHDVDLDREITDAEDQFSPLSLSVGEHAPPSELWNRIDSALDVELDAMSGRTLQSLNEGEWEPLSEGVEFKSMWNKRTRILRCKPGAKMPDHDHDDVEHLVVLSGDLIIGGRTFVAGDYIRSPKGHDGHLHTSRHGCLLLWQIGA